MNKALPMALCSCCIWQLASLNPVSTGDAHSTGEFGLGGFGSIEEFLQEPGNLLWGCALGILFLHPASD